MPSTTQQKNDKQIGYVRVAMVGAVTAVLAALGLGVAAINTPHAGQHCSLRNATARDATGRTMWCNPPSTGNHDVVWQYAPGS